MAAHAMRAELMDAMLNDGYKSLGEYDDRNPKK
jgi:dihydroorotate dehydrogenase